MRTGRLILYRDFEGSRLLRDMVWLMENYEDEFYEQEDVAGLLYDCMNRLLEMAGKYGFYGNLWHCYLTDILVNDENSYSCAAEMRGYADGTLNRAALHDLRIFKELYDFDLLKMADLSKATSNARCSSPTRPLSTITRTWRKRATTTG